MLFQEVGGGEHCVCSGGRKVVLELISKNGWNSFCHFPKSLISPSRISGLLSKNRRNFTSVIVFSPTLVGMLSSLNSGLTPDHKKKKLRQLHKITAKKKKKKSLRKASDLLIKLRISVSN